MDIFKTNILVGVSSAVAVLVLAPVLGPVIATVGRPIAKSLLKGGLMLYEKGREAAALAGETVEDMVAEIKAEETAPASAAPEHPAPAANTELSPEPNRRNRPGMTAI